MGGKVGISAAAPLSFYPRSGSDGKVELHSYPIGIMDHALGLVGKTRDSLKAFTDLANPAATAFPADTVADWTSFTMSGTGLHRPPRITAAGYE